MRRSRRAHAADGVGPKRIGPFTVPMMIADMAAGSRHPPAGSGPNYAIVSAARQASHGIGEASEIINEATRWRCYAGGSEATITSATRWRLLQIKATSDGMTSLRSCRPSTSGATASSWSEGR